MQTRDVRGQKMPRNANVICERSLNYTEIVENAALWTVGLNVEPEIQTLNELYSQRVLKIVIVKKSPISVHLVIEKISI